MAAGGRCRDRQGGRQFFSLSLPGVTHSPDRAVPVFAEQEAAVFRDSDSDGAPPNVSVGCDKTRHKIFILAARFAGGMVERDANNFVTSTFLPVPRTVKCSEDISLVFGGELVAGVKAQIKRRGMRFHKYFGNDDFVGELGMFALVVRIDMVANVEPGPAIKAARAHTADVIRWQILPDFVPLVRAHPELIAARSTCNPHGVPNSPCVNFLPAAIRIELENAGTISFRGIIGIIRARADRDV